MNKTKIGDEYIDIQVQKTQAHFKRIRNPKGPDLGIGKFFLILNVTAKKEAVYIPLSIASGKKPTGFIYQIEGTAEGNISTTDITCRGEGITQITLGTLLYSKIPAGKTAAFRIFIEIKGKAGKVYKVVINRINYKLNPEDTRYKRFDKEINTNALKFD